MTGEFGSMSNAIARVGASFFVQSAALVAVALGAARLLGRTAALRSAICRATLAAVIALPLAAVLAWAAGLSVELVPFPEARLPRGEAPGGELARSPSRIAAGDASDHAQRSEGPLEGLPPGDASDSSDAGDRSPRGPATIAYACLAFSMLWAAGATLLLGHLVVCHLSLAGVRRRARALADGELARELWELSSRLGVPAPALLASVEIRSPLLTGFVAPAVLLPAADATAPAETLRAVLLHELAHLARHDCLANLTARVACAVFFFQPLVWVLARRMEQASDEVADDVVLNAGIPATSYARALADWAERYLPSRREAAAALGVVRFRSALARRVRRVLDAASRRITRLPRRAILAVGVATAALGLAVSLPGFGSRPVEEEQDESPDSPFSWMNWCERRWPSPAYGRASARVYRGEGASRRLIGVDIGDGSGVPALCEELERGATGLTVWCGGDLLQELPLLPPGRELTLVCNAEGLPDLAPLKDQRGIRELVLYGFRGDPDLTPLAGMTELECVRIVRRMKR